MADNVAGRPPGPADVPEPHVAPIGRHRGPERPEIAPSFRTGRRIRRRNRSRRRRVVGGLMVGAGALLLVGFAWIAVTGLMARAELETARGGVRALRDHLSAGDLEAAARDARGIADHARRAHELTTGPAWALAAQVPAGGEAVETVRGVASAVDRLAATTLPELVTVRRELDPSTLRGEDGRIDVSRVAAAAPGVARAAAELHHELAALRGLPADTWLAGADNARRDSLAQLDDIERSVRSADLATRILPGALGRGGTVRYFVAFQNDAEARGTGGLPGAFGILALTDGRARFERFESDSALDNVRANVGLGSAYNALYAGANPTGLYVNSNLSANFPYAARIWTAMWLRKTGEHLDGAIALDPTALSYLLGATGTATLPDGTKVDAGNVAELTQSTAYARFGSRVAARREYLKEVARSASQVIIDSRGSAKNLFDAASQAADQRRLLVWSDDPDVERLVDQTSFGGVVPLTDRPYAGLSIINDGGDKLDYYLDRDVDWRRTGCGRTRDVTATIRLTNNAPVGLPPAVTQRSDVHLYAIRPGDNRLLVNWYATTGAELTSVTVDGAAVGAHAGAERGHPVYTVDLELPRGTARTIVFHLREPGTGGSPDVLRQPLVRPLTVRTSESSCS